MIGKILCFLGFHDWLEAGVFVQWRIEDMPMKCSRCPAEGIVTRDGNVLEVTKKSLKVNG